MNLIVTLMANKIWFHVSFGLMALIGIFLASKVKTSRAKKVGLSALITLLALACDLLLLKHLEFLGTATEFWNRKTKIGMLDRLEYFTGFVRTSLFEIGVPLVACATLFLFVLWRLFESHMPSRAAHKTIGMFLCIASVFLTAGLSLPALILVSLFHKHRTRVQETKLSGADVYEKNMTVGLHRIEQSLKPDSCSGIEILPHLNLTKAQECTHLLYVGAQGSGKTNLLFGTLQKIIERGDKVVVYDYKGDFTSYLACDNRVALLTPFDSRSFVWDVAKDLTTELDAEEFAKVLCPDDPFSTKPFFAIAARDLIVGCIKKLQVEMESQWTFSDLYALVSLKDNIESACRAHRIEALQTIGSAENDQGLGVIGELRNRTRTLAYLAKAWPTRENAVSIREWLKTKSEKNCIIIQSNSKFGELDKFFTVQIYSFLFREVLALEDSFERRVWAIIDELPTLPAIPDFTNSLRAGRSKGLCVVAAIQDFGRIKEIYKRDGGLEAFANGFGVKLIGRLNSPESAEYASQICGDVEVERTIISRSRSQGKEAQNEQPGQIVKKRAVPASQFLNLKLSNLREPARFYYVSSGLPIVLLKHKIVRFEKKGEASVGALWMTKTPKQEFDFAKLPSSGLGDFAIKIPEAPC